MDKLSMKDWGESKVGEWLRELGFAEYEQIFKEQSITGEVLPELTDGHLRDELGVKILGHRLKIIREIKKLIEKYETKPLPITIFPTEVNTSFAHSSSTSSAPPSASTSSPQPNARKYSFPTPPLIPTNPSLQTERIFFIKRFEEGKTKLMPNITNNFIVQTNCPRYGKDISMEDMEEFNGRLCPPWGSSPSDYVNPRDLSSALDINQDEYKNSRSLRTYHNEFEISLSQSEDDDDNDFDQFDDDRSEMIIEDYHSTLLDINFNDNISTISNEKKEEILKLKTDQQKEFYFFLKKKIKDYKQKNWSAREEIRLRGKANTIWHHFQSISRKRFEIEKNKLICELDQLKNRKIKIINKISSNPITEVNRLFTSIEETLKRIWEIKLKLEIISCEKEPPKISQKRKSISPLQFNIIKKRKLNKNKEEDDLNDFIDDTDTIFSDDLEDNDGDNEEDKTYKYNDIDDRITINDEDEEDEISCDKNINKVPRKWENSPNNNEKSKINHYFKKFNFKEISQRKEDEIMPTKSSLTLSTSMTSLSSQTTPVLTTKFKNSSSDPPQNKSKISRIQTELDRLKIAINAQDPSFSDVCFSLFN